MKPTLNKPQFNTFLAIQKIYMNTVGQVDLNGKILTPCNYTNFYDEERVEYKKAAKQNNKLEQVDALGDMVVCLCGQVITKEIEYEKALKKFEEITAKGKEISHFFEAVNEIFENNRKRLIFDENGKVKLQPEFLENGEPNPKAGKVMKQDLTPNLTQFLI